MMQVIAHAPTYEEALSKLYRALDEFLVRGVKTNIGFVCNVIKHPEFAAGKATTSFIERNTDYLFKVNDEGLMGQKLMNYLSEMVVNGPNHPGAIGNPSSKHIPVVPEFPHLKGNELKGWKNVLTAEGPEGWAKKVRAHKGLLITDTTMRDAHQSLLATRMRTYDLLCAAKPTAKVRHLLQLPSQSRKLLMHPAKPATEFLSTS
jgi:pyruvate carboxylase